MKAADFSAFFEAATGHRPFHWQRRLLDKVVEDGHWPATLAAPTGSGKTSAIHIHTFANAIAAVHGTLRVPRRLVMTVNRRALVDSQEQEALALQKLLREARTGILAEVAEALLHLGTARASSGLPIRVTSLRGGSVPESGWLEDPGLCQVICATPDMVGSRLLFSGYGASRLARPREAGLLSFDTVLVLDEAHLNRQLLLTVNRVSGLVRDSSDRIEVPGLQVMETTATPAGGDEGFGVTADDLTEPDLAARLTRPKPVEVKRTAAFPLKGRPSAVYLGELVAEVKRLHDAAGGKTIGCFVNRVGTALLATQALRRAGLRVKTWTGPMRPMDLEVLQQQHPGLFTVAGDPDVDVLVATQTVEVGVDIDLGGLVTEIAAGASLAQRSGRVNRLGARALGPIVVMAPTQASDCPPYGLDEVAAALEWLERRNADPTGLAPWALRDDPPPAAQMARVALHRLEAAEARFFALTSERLFAHSDMEIWLRDNLEEDLAMGVVLREGLSHDVAEALAQLRATPIHDSEVFPTNVDACRRIIQRVMGSEKAPHARAFLRREDDLVVLWDAVPLQPGDVLILDADHPVTTERVIDPEATQAENPPTRWGAPGTRLVLPATVDLPGPWENGKELLNELAAVGPEEAVELFQSLAGQSYQIALAPAVQNSRYEDEIPWAVISQTPADEEERQVWTPSRRPVTLQDHGEAVAARAALICHRVGLKDEVSEALVVAARHHDEGKAHPRFQVALGAGEEVLAKSRFRSRQMALRARSASGLPLGWRHEQASVVLTDAAVAEDVPHRELILRLIGTSHGHGRSTFGFAAERLGVEGAQRWFSSGEWEALMERTEAKWGSWGCAYLEALLRSADTQISSEGS